MGFVLWPTLGVHHKFQYFYDFAHKERAICPFPLYGLVIRLGLIVAYNAYPFVHIVQPGLGHVCSLVC